MVSVAGFILLVLGFVLVGLGLAQRRWSKR